MTKKTLKIFFLILMVLTVGLFFSVNTNSSRVFPLDETQENVYFDTYHEGLDSGYSEAEVNYSQISNPEITFTYQLTENQSVQEPFSALFFYRKDTTQPFFDLTKFNTISLDLKSFRGKRIPITFTLNYEGFTSKDKELTNLPLTYLLEYKGFNRYDISLDKFEIPSWWLRHHKIKKEDLQNIDYSRVNYIVIGSCQLLERGIEDEITVGQVLLHNNNSLKYIVFGSLVLLSAVILVLFRLVKREKIIVPYTKVDLGGKYGNGTTKVDALVNYIGDNYANPELSLDDIQVELGISTREIGKLFKNELGSSFKKYLNLVRLTEVKRLLVETDQTISVIAYNTGYNNVSHFNRVFKVEEKVSPKEYREQFSAKDKPSR